MKVPFLELLEKSRVGRTDQAMGFFLLINVILLMFIRNPFILHVFIMIYLFATISLGWNIVSGYAGQFSFGHTLYFGLGSYTSTLLYLHFGLSPWLGMLAAMGVTTVVSIIIGYPVLRIRGPFFALATLALAEVFWILAVYLRDLTKGSLGLTIPFKPHWSNLMFDSKMPYAFVALGLMLVALIVTILIERSSWKLYLVSIKEEEDVADSLGINTFKWKMLALILSGCVTSLGGVFYAQYILYIDPDSVFSIDITVMTVILGVLGGVGTPIGPMLGAFVLVPIQEISRGFFSGMFGGLHLIVYGILGLAVTMFVPTGLFGVLSESRLYNALTQRDTE